MTRVSLGAIATQDLAHPVAEDPHGVIAPGCNGRHRQRDARVRIAAETRSRQSLPRKALSRHLPDLVVLLCVLVASTDAGAQGRVGIENSRLRLSFDRKTGTLVAIENKLAAETYQICGDECGFDALEGRTAFADLKLVSLGRQGEVVSACYKAGQMAIEASYTLRGESHFVEKRLTLTWDRNCGLKKVVVSRPTFSCPGLQVVSYRYPKFGRAPGAEPECTFFGRTARGGFFTGLEHSYDASAAKGNTVVLEFAPSLKIAANERFICKPAYFGVYRRGPLDKEEKGGPLQSESSAMVAMTSAILGPPRFGLVPMMNGWCSQMVRSEYTEQSVAADMKALDVMAQCGIDWYSDAHPWGGEITKMNALGPTDKYQPGPLVRKFLAHARKLDVKMVLFATINNTHAWAGGKPFRPDRPEWLIDAGAGPPAAAPAWRKPGKGNCMGIHDFSEWLQRINLEAIAGGPYPGWAIDGDFFGGGGTVAMVVPANCQSRQHDHLPGNSDFASQQALAGIMAGIRRHCPQTYIWTCRPPQELGIWAMQNVDACFTLDEYGTKADNLLAGDRIRSWSRIRVHHDFFPHYLDQPQLFPSVRPGNWSGKKLDYILLSALSSSPNQLYYLPVKLELPDRDRAELRKWLDWGRKNIEYLKVRKDLPGWPAADKVDGSAHIVGDRGLIFLFNPSQNALTGEFDLTEERIGLRATGHFQVSQEYPLADRKITSDSGKTIRWDLPPTTAVVLRIQPVTR